MTVRLSVVLWVVVALRTSEAVWIRPCGVTWRREWKVEMEVSDVFVVLKMELRYVM